MRKLAFVILAVFGAVSVSFAYDLTKMQKSGEEYVKVVVEELEKVKKQTRNNYIGEDGEYVLSSGKKFLEFVEKVKQSPQKDCDRAVIDVMSDRDNWDKYYYYNWSQARTHLGCMNIDVIVDSVRGAKKWLDNKGIKHNLP